MRVPPAPAFAGAPAMWRRIIGGSGAVKIGGSPFKMLAEAEAACDIILKQLVDLFDAHRPKIAISVSSSSSVAFVRS